eukprot:TRINITY_DN80760_c0_g1_i1.p1 TRINITY_DN80760_c0_g1~~TRINITY_DN80760_c0_g1_i1.p1  ORF type:complete len:453 (+),score=55.50 TRINITY_DN80760_c0_g1_i1:96-1454(+)
MQVCQALQRHALRLFVLFTLHPRVSATFFTGSLSNEANVRHFVGKFVFDFRPNLDESVGTVTVKARRDGPPLERSRDGRLFFFLFDDERSHWKRVRRHWNARTCDELIQAASLHSEIVLSTEEHEVVYTIQIREHLRPRFWYFAFAACDLKLNNPLEYEVHAENDMWPWQKEFSLDHIGLLHCYATYSVMYAVTLGCTVLALRRGDGPPRREHPYVQLLLMSLCSSVASCCLFSVHYALFMQNGFGSKRIHFMGVLGSIVADCTIFLIAIFASVGWAISTAVLPQRRVFLSAVALVGGLNGLLELRASTMTDLSTKVYSYQSTPGLFSLILKVFMTCWFCYQIRIVHDEETKEKRRKFYKVLGVGFSVWSLHVPVAVVICFILSPWVRYKVVTILDVASRFLWQVLLSWLLCGPLSPLGAENIFTLRDDDADARELSFTGLSNGPEGSYSNY